MLFTGAIQYISHKISKGYKKRTGKEINSLQFIIESDTWELTILFLFFLVVGSWVIKIFI